MARHVNENDDIVTVQNNPSSSRFIRALVSFGCERHRGSIMTDEITFENESDRLVKRVQQ